jgi:hypothetical protein
MLASAAALVPTVASADGASPVTWDPDSIAFGAGCAESLVRVPRGELCLAAVAPDGAGGLHVFLTMDQLAHTDGKPIPIEHYLVTGRGVRAMPTLTTLHSGPMVLQATAGPNGDVHLLWVEQEYRDPAYHRGNIYTQVLKDGIWNEPRSVDDDAMPSVLGPRDLGLTVNADGSIDAFWNDLREYHRFKGMFSVCDDGHVDKTWHRRLTGDGGEPAEQIQKRGIFRPEAFRVLPSHGGAHQVFWTSHSGSTATINRVSRTAARWSVEDTVARCHSPVGSANVLEIEVPPGPDPPARLAWVCSNYDFIEPGTGKNSDFNDLYVSTLDHAKWMTGPRITRDAQELKWLWESPEQTLLLMQESKPLIPGSTFLQTQGDSSIVIRMVRGNEGMRSCEVVQRAVDGFLQAATEANGTVHLLYAEQSPESGAVLRCRRGTVVRP